MHSGYPMFAAGASDQPPNSCQDGPGRGPVGWDRPLMVFFVSAPNALFFLTVCPLPICPRDWNGGGNAVRPDYVNDTHLFLRHLVVGTYA